MLDGHILRNTLSQDEVTANFFTEHKKYASLQTDDRRKIRAVLKHLKIYLLDKYRPLEMDVAGTVIKQDASDFVKALDKTLISKSLPALVIELNVSPIKESLTSRKVVKVERKPKKVKMTEAVVEKGKRKALSPEMKEEMRTFEQELEAISIQPIKQTETQINKEFNDKKSILDTKLETDIQTINDKYRKFSPQIHDIKVGQITIADTDVLNPNSPPPEGYESWASYRILTRIRPKASEIAAIIEQYNIELGKLETIKELKLQKLVEEKEKRKENAKVKKAKIQERKEVKKETNTLADLFGKFGKF